MQHASTYDQLLEHPVFCADAFCRWFKLDQGPCPRKHPARLQAALRELLGELTTAQRATNGGNYQALAQLLLRADIHAPGLLGRQSSAAYEWLRIRWREPQPPPMVIQAWKIGLAQLISWVRNHCRNAQALAAGSGHRNWQQAA